MNDPGLVRLPLAPPFLRAGRQLIAQTANILHFLGPRLGLVPDSAAGRLWVHQLQLTVEDLVVDVHDTHHPVAMSLYYEEQKAEAVRRAGFFTRERAPELLGYFENVLQRNPGGRVSSSKSTTSGLNCTQVEGVAIIWMSPCIPSKA